MIYRQISLVLFLSIFIFSCGPTTSTSESDTSEVVTETETPPSQNTLTEEETAAGWKLLFDGSTTNGWRNYGQDSVKGWTIKDGELIVAGGAGDIMTTDTYKNYELSMEWKISDRRQ